LNKKVRLQTDANELDQFGRTLAYVFVEQRLINKELLARGAGKYFEDYLNHKYQSELIAAAKAAHSQKLGLWSECAEDKTDGCLVKGNLDPNDRRFYHLPHFRHYSQIVMNLDKGDRWFCSEQEAIAAGFKRARE
jgi:micrococcal nuclease